MDVCIQINKLKNGIITGPGSVFEFYKIIPLLTNPIGNSEFAFEVIAPSIPGYGWSEQSHKKGSNIKAILNFFILYTICT